MSKLSMCPALLVCLMSASCAVNASETADIDASDPPSTGTPNESTASDTQFVSRDESEHTATRPRESPPSWWFALEWSGTAHRVEGATARLRIDERSDGQADVTLTVGSPYSDELMVGLVLEFERVTAETLALMGTHSFAPGNRMPTFDLQTEGKSHLATSGSVNLTQPEAGTLFGSIDANVDLGQSQPVRVTGNFESSISVECFVIGSEGSVMQDNPVAPNLIQVPASDPKCAAYLSMSAEDGE